MPAPPDVNSPDMMESAAALARADQGCAFGPSFFLGQLGRFVRDHCPAPEEHLPLVQLRLADGQILDLCHIIGVSPRWVMLAVRDASAHPSDMVIDLVPFQSIQRVTIRARHTEGATVGFLQSQPPAIMEAETLLRGAMGHPTETS